MNPKLNSENMDMLFSAILSLGNVEECYKFFEDLCTINELKAMEQRFTVARMLSRGMVYSDIAQQTGASSATISRVNRSLTYGEDGYRIALERLDEDGV